MVQLHNISIIRPTSLKFSYDLVMPIIRCPVPRMLYIQLFTTQLNSAYLYNLLQEKSMRLWAFLLSVYWVSFVTYFVLWKSYKHVSNLRATARSAPDVKPEEFAVLVRDIPRPSPDETIKDSVDSYFRALHPNTFYRSMVVTDHTKVLLLLIYRERDRFSLVLLLCFSCLLVRYV